MRKKTITVGMIIVLQFLICAKWAWSQNEKKEHITETAYDQSTNTIYADLFTITPWGFYDEKGRLTGITYDIMTEICREAGVTCVIRLVPFARMLYNLEYGTSYFAVIYPDTEMERYMKKVELGGYLETAVISMKGSGFMSLKDLHGKLIGTIRGVNYSHEFMDDTHIPKYKLNTMEQGLKMLKAHRIDGIAGTTLAVYYVANKQGYSKNDFDKPLVLNTREWWLFVSKKANNEKITKALKNATVVFRESNKMEAIIKKYVDD